MIKTMITNSCPAHLGCISELWWPNTQTPRRLDKHGTRPNYGFKDVPLRRIVPLPRDSTPNQKSDMSVTILLKISFDDIFTIVMNKSGVL